MSLVSFELKFPDLAQKLKKHEKDIELFIAAQMQFNRGMMFDQEGAYNGHDRWAELKFRDGQILSRRGTLRKSIAPKAAQGKPGPGGIVKFGSGLVTIGSSLKYAALMNWGTTKLPGGVLVPKNAKALKIPVPQGNKAGVAAKAIQDAALDKQIRKIYDKIARTKSQKTFDKLILRLNVLESKKGEGKGPVKFIFRKSVRIPERRYDQWNSEDQKELSIAVRNKIVKVLNK